MSTAKLLRNGLPRARRGGIALVLTLIAACLAPVSARAASAAFVTTDMTTQGNWKGVYGGDGYNVVGDTSSNNPSDPGYAATNASGAVTNVIAASTADVRGLKTALPASTTRIAADLQSASSFNLDINFTDSAPHQVALYMVDWNSAALTQSITIKDGGTNAVLDTQQVSAFAAGKYLVWKIAGHVVVTVSKTGTSSAAVLNGWFLDYPGPTISKIVVSPGSASVAAGTNKQFTATALDQAGNPLTTQPAFNWTASGGGSVTTTGQFMAGTTVGGPFTITASSGGISGTASVNVAATHIVTFGSGTPYSLPSVSYLTVADLDGDGHQDLIAQTSSSGLVFYYGKGDGTFDAVTYPYSITTGYVAVGKLRGGANADIVCSSGNNIAVIKNLGNRTYAAPVTYASSVNSQRIALGDFNEDGSLDVATVGSDHNDLAVFLNNGDGTLGAAWHHEIWSNYMGYAIGIVATDADSDGHIDLACSVEDEFAPALVNLFLGDGKGHFDYAPNWKYVLGGGPLIATDLNNDGILDLANSDHWAGQPRWGLGDGKGNFPFVYTQQGDGWAGRLTVADFDGDGYNDLDQSYDTVNSLFINNGDGTFPLAVHNAFAATNPAAGDFNEDGQPDIAVWNNNVITVYMNTTNPRPTITNVTPDGVAAGGAATIVVQGHGLLSRSVVNFNNAALPTTFDYRTGALTASLTAAQLANVGTGTITVVTGAPGGGTSNSVPLYIGKIPTSISITPSPASVNAGAFLQFTANVLDQTGTPMPAQPLITWKTSGKANTISPMGLFSAGNTAGTFPITASYGTLQATVNVKVTDFTLSASPAALTVPQGSFYSSTITVAPANGFAGKVMLSASQAPAGVVATFTPGSTSTTSVVTFTASPTATLGTYPIVITGVADGNPEKTTINVTVGASASPAVPANVKATAGDRSINVSWSASSGATSYNVYQSSGGSAYTLVKNTAATNYQVTGLTNGTAYSFEVAAVSAAGSSANSNPVTATPVGVQITAGPAATRNGTSATITWTTNVAANSQVNYGATTSLGTMITDATLVTSHSVTLTGLNGNTIYYRVASSDGITSAASSSQTISAVSLPSITSFTPASGPVGTSVTIMGTNLTGATAVKFNGTAATTFNVASATSITATVPAGATSGTISVTTPAGAATSTGTFTVTSTASAPTITSFTPSSGPIGTVVTVTGSGYFGTPAVYVNRTSATNVTVLSPTTMTFVVAPGSTSGKITIRTAAGSVASAAVFTVTTAAPALQSFTFSPTTISAGGSSTATVTLTAAAPAGGALVTISQGPFASFPLTIPAGATSGSITISANAGAPPAVYSFSASYASQSISASLTVK